MRKLQRFMSLVVFPLFVAAQGCGTSGAFENTPSTQEVSLSYQDPPPPPPSKGAVVVVVATGEQRFWHDAKGRKIIGSHDTSKKKADVVTVEPIGRWISEAIAGELRFAGYQATVVEDPTNATCVVRPRIDEVRIDSRTAVYNEEEAATIALSYEVVIDGRLAGADTYSLRREFEPFASIGPSKRQALEITLRLILSKVVPKMESFIDQATTSASR